MQIFEFLYTDGFKEFRDFIAESLLGADEGDDAVFARMGFHKWDELLSQEGMQWITTYKNDNSATEFSYIIAVENPVDVEYIVCRSFIDYLEFMHKYLPTLKNMSDAALEFNKARK